MEKEVHTHVDKQNCNNTRRSNYKKISILIYKYNILWTHQNISEFVFLFATKISYPSGEQKQLRKTTTIKRRTYQLLLTQFNWVS